MAVEFYNPGPAIYEKLRFDHPTNDIKSQNLISYFQIDVPGQSYFDVPTEVGVQTEQGEQFVSVRFADRIQADYRALAVVRVNPKAKNINEEDNVAGDRKEAKVKAERLWRDAMLQLVREHEKTCYEIKAAGLKPQRAKGTIAHALKTLGIEDPANDVADVLERKRDTSEVDSLKQQIAELRSMVLKKA